jgi:hypothetical protein
MAVFENALGGWGSSALVGVGAVLAVPFVLPVVGAIIRPVAKGLVKGYFLVADVVQAGPAETSEQVRDLRAEARAERKNGRTHTTSNSRARSRNGHKKEAKRLARAKHHRLTKWNTTAARAA